MAEISKQVRIYYNEQQKRKTIFNIPVWSFATMEIHYKYINQRKKCGWCEELSENNLANAIVCYKRFTSER